MEQAMSIQAITSGVIDIPKLVRPFENLLGESIPLSGAIIAALIRAITQDLQKQDASQFDDDVGWRNKYNIHLLSGVPQKEIYSEEGVLAKLVDAEIVQERPSRSRWGKQRHQYRLRVQHH